jgi:hypothetical protein
LYDQNGKDETPNSEEQETLKAEKPEGEEERLDDKLDETPEVKEDQKNVPKEEEDRRYRDDPAFPMMERHARDFRKAAAGTSAKTKSTVSTHQS